MASKLSFGPPLRHWLCFDVAALYATPRLAYYTAYRFIRNILSGQKQTQLQTVNTAPCKPHLKRQLVKKALN